MEYLVIEYASDVEIQTPETKTTQDNAIMYLVNHIIKDKNKTSSYNVCVINIGLHDQLMCKHPNTTSSEECDDIYLENVEN